jgi:hypothetical protein
MSGAPFTHRHVDAPTPPADAVIITDRTWTQTREVRRQVWVSDSCLHIVSYGYDHPIWFEARPDGHVLMRAGSPGYTELLDPVELEALAALIQSVAAEARGRRAEAQRDGHSDSQAVRSPRNPPPGAPGDPNSPEPADDRG